MNKIIITKMVPPDCAKEAIVSGILEGDKLSEVYLENVSSQSKLNNIYIGKVQNIVKNINAAFIEFEKDCVGYYPLEELPSAIFTQKQGKKPLSAGDELLVQVVKEPMKTKAAALTSNLSFPGKYFVLTTGKCGIGLSGKLSSSKKQYLKQLVETNLEKDTAIAYGIIVRTNAANAEDETLIAELKSLIDKAELLLSHARHRTVFSLLSQEQPEYMKLIKNAYAGEMDAIVTDDRDIFETVQNYLKQFQPQDCDKLTFYEDKLLPLAKLYNLELQLSHATHSHVWLKSGAYLIIEQTEAFTVIDVNTGKFDGKKSKKDTFLKINVEAAKETARQIRLRNLSGIILVDFINMERKEDINCLMKEFAGFVKNDRIKTVVVDMTALGIVEVTRRKKRVCLLESLKQFT